ncbi:DUF5700 domain-containing putative Zn-dependent protease [Granulicella paludicola]|uniref:DUF5700 domain-containing putative Zn-dependent protease n=1 Tax=Granulicella paludicola TaxID=474951 RepID=UPI0021E08C15|nr:DUF5700 domain-containing putative Zn-dependent protease [Granulicella paludicola]
MSQCKFLATPKLDFIIKGFVLLVGALFFVPIMLSQQIKIDTASARAMLKALQNSNLTNDQAMTVAKLEGNQGMIKEMHGLGEADTEEQFAHALVAAAHGLPARTPAEESYMFSAVKNSAPAISALLDQIEAGFQTQLRDHIRPYVARPDSVSVRGFVVAGGDGGGYAFGGQDFYLNIALNDDIVMAKQVMIHEAFHGAQGAVYHEDTEHWAKERTLPADLVRGAFCSSTAELFMDMRNEGTAKFVGSDDILKDAKGPTGQRPYAESLYGKEHLSDSANLLEISIASLQAPTPVPYRVVYSVDFWGRGIVYSISSAMVSAIVDQDGPAAVAQVIQQPGYDFVLRYTRLKNYGKDRAHPRLGENTVSAAQSLHDGCPSGSPSPSTAPSVRPN